MKIRKNRNKHKVIKDLLNSESAAATVIAAVLLLSIIFTIFAIVRIAYIPEWKNDAEQLHMSEVQGDMTELKSTVDMITFLQSNSNSSSDKFPLLIPPVTVPISMGGGEIPILDPSKSSGTLSINKELCNIIITNSSMNTTLRNQTCGGITYYSNNRQYVDQTFRYENGAVILAQGDRSLMTQFPSLFRIIQTGLHNYTVFIQAIDISGNPDTISSETYTSLRLNGSGPNIIDLGDTDSFDYTITTKYPDAWKNYFKGNVKGIARGTELKYSTDFRLDPNNYSDKVSLKFLAGSNNQNRYRLFVRESVIAAEIGAKSSFNYTSTGKPPVANFSSNVIKGYAPLSVQFTDLSKGATEWSWDFENDGTVDSIDESPVHMYEVPGNYTVNLTVSNAKGTNSTLATINVLRAYAYITNYRSNTVSVVDTATNNIITTLNVGNNPAGVAVNPMGTKVYVANEGDGTVSVINTAEDKVTNTVNVGKWPYGVAVNPTGTKVYVANQGDGTISVIDTTNNIVTSTMNVGKWPFGVAVSPTGTKAFVTKQGDSTVSVIDTANNIVTSTINVGKWPYGVAVSPTGTKAYVANQGDGTVSVIDTAEDKVTNTVNVGKWPYGVAVSPMGTKAYVANQGDGTVSVIDTAEDKVTNTVNVGNNPAGIAVSPMGTRVYVADQGSNAVSVIDTDTNNITMMNVGREPIALGQFIVPFPA